MIVKYSQGSFTGSPFARSDSTSVSAGNGPAANKTCVEQHLLQITCIHERLHNVWAQSTLCVKS